MTANSVITNNISVWRPSWNPRWRLLWSTFGVILLIFTHIIVFGGKYNVIGEWYRHIGDFNTSKDALYNIIYIAAILQFKMATILSYFRCGFTCISVLGAIIQWWLHTYGWYTRINKIYLYNLMYLEIQDGYCSIFAYFQSDFTHFQHNNSFWNHRRA